MPAFPPGGEHARRAETGDIQRAAGTLAAAHGQNDRARFHGEQPVFAADCRDDLFRGNAQYHCAELVRDMQSLCAFFKTSGVLRTRELLFKRVQTEAVVDALV